MSWLDRYRQASFRNIDFFVANHRAGGGRRLAVHEFPQEDTPYPQDMGRRARRFSLTAYVLGEDYFTMRNRLIDACEKKGRGLLVHPYFGTLFVRCDTYSVSETVAETRIARFTIEFVEAGEFIFPTEVIDAQDSIISARAAALLAINNWFIASYSIARKPFNIVNNARETVGVGFAAIASAKKVLGTIPEFKDAVQDAIDDVVNLTADAVALAAETQQLLSFGTLPTDIFAATAENARFQFESLRPLFDFTPEKDRGADDPSNQFSNLLAYSALVVVSGLTAVMDYDSFSDAREIITVIIDQIDLVLLDENLDDNISLALKELQKVIIESINLRDVDLARLSIVVLTIAQPALVLSHSLYGDVDQEDDILNRNKLGHPGFVPAGQNIEVLLDA